MWVSREHKLQSGFLATGHNLTILKLNLSGFLFRTALQWGLEQQTHLVLEGRP